MVAGVVLFKFGLRVVAVGWLEWVSWLMGSVLFRKVLILVVVG